MKNDRMAYRVVAAGLLALLAVLVAFVAFGAEQAVPNRTIPTPAPAFASETMYIAPGETGTTQGGESKSREESNAQSEQINEIEQENEPEQSNESAAKESSDSADVRIGGGVDGGTARDGNNGENSAEPDSQDATPPSSDKPDNEEPAPGPVIPGIYTNLGNYRSINATTPAPSKLALTLQDKSGLSHFDKLLYFYAIPSDASGGYSVLVEYANAVTSGEWKQLEGLDGLFGLPIELSDGASTDVTLTLVDSQGSRTNRTASYKVTYEGRKGPEIAVNIEDGQRIVASPMALTVSAHDSYDGSVIYPEHIEVRVEGAGQAYIIAQQGSSDPYSYALDFANYQLSGDDTEFTITVRAWDYSIEQASTTVTRSVVYEHHAFGDGIGTATIVIDATTVGLGIVSTFEINLHQGYAFPQDLIEGLAEAGMTPNYSGTFGRSFYLSGITSGGAFAGQEIPETLMYKLSQDKITFTGLHSSDSLSDHDYTNMSGWLYNVNNSWWPSVSLDGYTATPGDTVYLIYSLTGGKDVGNGGGGSGALSSYCGIWRDGTYIEDHDLSDYVVVEEPTCAEEGRARYVCTVPGCGAWGSQQGARVSDGKEIVLPATGEHSWQFDPLNSEMPVDGFDGVRSEVCSVCGATRSEAWPWEGAWPPQDDSPGGSDENSPGGSDDDSPEDTTDSNDAPEPSGETGDLENDQDRMDGSSSVDRSDDSDNDEDASGDDAALAGQAKAMKRTIARVLGVLSAIESGGHQ